MYKLSESDRIWNRALEIGRRFDRPGDRALSALLRADSLIANGGVLHCTQLLSRDEIDEALAGYAFFGFGRVAEVFRRAQATTEAEADAVEAELDAAYSNAVADARSGLQRAFEAHYRSHREDFEPLST